MVRGVINYVNKKMMPTLFKHIKSQYLLIFLFQLLFFNSCSNKIIESCTNNNYLSNNNINPANNFKNRRELKTKLLKSDFDLLYKKFGLNCSDLLVEHFYCNICFNSYENSLTSYDGRKYVFDNNISATEITNECLNFISTMSIGGDEYSTFFKNQE